MFKDRDSWVRKIQAALDQLRMEHEEERAMRKMLEQQYASLKKKVESQVSGSLPYMGVLRLNIPSTSLGSVAGQPPSEKRGRREEGGSATPPRDDRDGRDGGAEGGGES